MDAGDLLKIHLLVAELFKARGRPLAIVGEASTGGTSAVIGRIEATFDGTAHYDSTRERAAVLCHGINASHTFHDGNKRTSLAAMIRYLDDDGFRVTCSDDELFTFVVSVAAHEEPYGGGTDEVVREMTTWVRENTKKKLKSLPSMKFSAFKERFEQLGGRVRTSRTNSTVLQGVGQNAAPLTIGIISSSRVDGKVAEHWLRETGMFRGESDYGPHDFFHGRLNQPLILDLLEVMDRLAEFDQTG